MLETLARNYNNRNAAASLFEISNEYIWKGEDVLPDENMKLTLGMYGADCDFFALKGAVEELLYKTGVKDYDVEPLTDNPTFHPAEPPSSQRTARQLRFWARFTRQYFQTMRSASRRTPRRLISLRFSSTAATGVSIPLCRNSGFKP